MAKTTPETPTRRPYEAWAVEQSTPAWLLAATKTLAGWGLGQEVTQEQFTQAVQAAASVKLG